MYWPRSRPPACGWRWSARIRSRTCSACSPHAAALFDDYECGTDLFGKAAKIDRLLQRHRIAPERFLLVGDEIRDIEAARKAGVRVASVGWGYNHVDELRERQPDELLLTVAELPAVLT